MATKPEDINPFAQYVEQPKAEPVKKATSEVNPFAKYQEYGVGTGLADASKNDCCWRYWSYNSHSFRS